MDFLQSLHITQTNPGVSTGKSPITAKGPAIESYSPVDGKLIGVVQSADRANYDAVVAKAREAFLQWRMWPAPKRGEVVRQIGEALPPL